MIFKWGRKSQEHRERLHPDLQRLVDELIVLTPFDVALTDSFRDEAGQTAAFLSGASKLEWPQSCHNSMPCRAVHIDPYPIDYDNWLRYYVLHGIVLLAARNVGLEADLRWGGNWDSDADFNEETFRDLAHYELRSRS